MALEAGTYISDLVVANPVAADGSGQGDDHLRLIKTVLKNTFPNVTGAVTPTHTVINGLDGRVTTIEGLYVKKDGSVAMTGALAMGTNKVTGLGAATVNGDAVRYEQLVLKQDIVITTRGDLVRGGAGGVAQRVALGTNGQYLKSDGTDAVWAAGPAAADLVTSGLVELATVAETSTGTDATRAVTPAGLAGSSYAPKAWACFTGINGGTAIKSAKGVSGVVRNSLGRYTVTFSTAFADTNYACLVTRNGVGSFVAKTHWTENKTTTTIDIACESVTDTGGGGNQAADDSTDISIVCFAV
jgi:hypothetical protein